MARTFRGFDTFEDAKTFQDFLMNHGFDGLSIMKDGNIWKVYYND